MGETDDDAGMFAAIIDYARLNPDDPLGLLRPEWRCMVCARLRLYAEISVAHVRPIPAHQIADATWNVSYCNDREQCTTVATGTEFWPPDAADTWCVPALSLHASPHRGCVLR